MEVVAAPPSGGGVPPFHDHDVREWSRLDSLTGVLERARLETDNWTANTNNAKHKYNKVVDSRARTDADGALQAQARRQLEVFQSQVPGGHLQVIKTHTVTSSRWSNHTNNSVTDTPSKDFENLQLALNPLDLSSEKSKASVGRSASRRPPTRQRLKPDTSAVPPQPNLLRDAHLTAAVNLHRVSRLCHQIHETAVRQAFGSRSPRPPIDERQSGDGSVEIYEIESVSSSNDSKSLNGHTNLSRTKSTSSEDVLLLTPEKDNANKSIEDLEDLEQLRNWRRTSKIRRSLQFPKQNKPQVTKPVDLPENSVSVKKIREDLEKGRRLNTALRGNNIDLEALDQILQSISSSSSVISDRTEDEEVKLITSKKKEKRNSFVTVESLQEVRGRLRRTSSPSSDIYSNKDEDIDDGIDTEDKPEMPHNDKPAPSRVRSYVFGMEAMLNQKKPILGTGSLESRSKLVNGNSNNRSEDWYNRRKSYGFEKVHSHDESTNSIANKTKNFVESSTDSGICRSTEIVVVPTVPKKNYSGDNSHNCSSENNSDNEANKSFIPFEPVITNNYGNVKKMTNLFNKEENYTNNNWTKRYPDWQPKATTITIPIVNNNTSNNSWNEDTEVKRHSIAVDDTMKLKNFEDLNRKTKKVEFCKTEVHFAADSGKVNIVETDEKPPPTNNFRRRRRNSGPMAPMNPDYNKNGLPVLHFGDTSYEKQMFGVSDDDVAENIYENVQPRVPPAFGVVTVNTNNHIDYQQEKKEHQENENIRGILKNKPVKPKPYHLGETVPFSNNSDDESKKWGVRLRPVKKEEPPIWKSTVSVHNSLYDKNDVENQPEFQKLLKNLRPTRKDSDSENGYSDGYSSVRVVPPVCDNRRSSWSVSDKQVEELQNGESKGYSTKVNFGDGEATVIESAENSRHPTWPRADNPKDSTVNGLKPAQNTNKPPEHPTTKYVNLSRHKFSPIVIRKAAPTIRPDLKTAPPTEKLSSPSLVGKNINGYDYPEPKNKQDRKSPTKHLNGRQSPAKTDRKSPTKRPPSPTKQVTTRLSPTKDLNHQKTDTKFQIRHDQVLRQPKKSEMTYFGVNVSPKQLKKGPPETKLSEKPDLLQHYNSTKPIAKPRRNSPESKKDSPIYENVNPVKTGKMDSSILEELTKAADQIIQAVNGYEDDRLSSGDEGKQLETISETKSWKQSQQTENSKSKPPNTRTKLKHNSSTSSVEAKKLVERKTPVKVTPEKSKKKVAESTPTSKSITKARRLQRASSREALLQSHGSSSEDLSAPVETPVRKPRLIKKTKATQLTITNGLEIAKKSPKKTDERVLNSLPEIRHKTAVSTIRSTQEKSSRDRSKHRSEEAKKRSPTKRDVTKGGRTETRSRTSASPSANKEAVTTHRTSTAHIKRCHRSETSTRH